MQRRVRAVFGGGIQWRWVVRIALDRIILTGGILLG